MMEIRRKKLTYPSGRTFMWILEFGNLMGRLEVLPPDPWDDDSAWLLRNLEIDPKYRNRGFGTSLVRYAIEHFGDHHLHLNVAPDNLIAIRIYKKFGFIFESKDHMRRRSN